MQGKWIKGGIAAMTMAALLLGSSGVQAVSDSEAITVNATHAARISITIDDTTADYGTDIGPDGTLTNSETTSVVDGGATSSNGAYFIWNPNSTGDNIKVKSNQVWSGTAAATANSGTSTTMTIASGVLRHSASAPATYAAAAAASAFSTTAAAPSPSWTNNTQGVDTFDYYFLLRVDWTDTTGTFVSTVTYSVSN